MKTDVIHPFREHKNKIIINPLLEETAVGAQQTVAPLNNAVLDPRKPRFPSDTQKNVSYVYERL
jgi:hypothetical protein